MNGPQDIETLLAWWNAGAVSRGGFFGYLLPMLRTENVDELMARIPAELLGRVRPWAVEICKAYQEGSALIEIGSGPTVEKEAFEALCIWLSRQSQ